MLEATGQVSLAYMTARTHGLEAEAERLLEILQVGGLEGSGLE